MAFDWQGYGRRVRAVVRAIPPGRVSSYGRVAALAGYPRHARHVGRVLSAGPGEAPVPWQRVLNAQGRVAPRGGGPPAGEGITRQQRLLEGEGVVFTRGRVDWERFGWRPEEGAASWLVDAEPVDAGQE